MNRTTKFPQKNYGYIILFIIFVLNIRVLTLCLQSFP